MVKITADCAPKYRRRPKLLLLDKLNRKARKVTQVKITKAMSTDRHQLVAVHSTAQDRVDWQSQQEEEK